MEKKLLFIVLTGFITFTSLAQSTTITPGNTQMKQPGYGDQLSVETKTGYNAYIDFKRNGNYTVGLMNSASPNQLRIGIYSNSFGINYNEDIVIDGTTRNIGFGTNNPQYRYHLYSPAGGAGGQIMLESYSEFPFLFFKSNNGANKGIGWYDADGDPIGFLYNNGGANKMHWGFTSDEKGVIDITIDGTTRNVGIGTANPTNANLHVYGGRENGEVNLKIEEMAGGIAGGLPGLSLVKSNKGAKLYGVSYDNAGGIQVANVDNEYAPVFASAFNVASDINVKKEVVNLETDDFEAYLNQIRNIQSATYRYQWEDAETRKNSHIGFIAQTLPKEVVTKMDATPDGSSSEVNLGYNLSDMIGLNVIGIKAVDAKIQKLEETIKLQQEQIALLIAEIENIKE